MHLFPNGDANLLQNESIQLAITSLKLLLIYPTTYVDPNANVMQNQKCCKVWYVQTNFSPWKSVFWKKQLFHKCVLTANGENWSGRLEKNWRTNFLGPIMCISVVSQPFSHVSAHAWTRYRFSTKRISIHSIISITKICLHVCICMYTSHQHVKFMT